MNAHFERVDQQNIISFSFFLFSQFLIWLLTLFFTFGLSGLCPRNRIRFEEEKVSIHKVIKREEKILINFSIWIWKTHSCAKWNEKSSQNNLRVDIRKWEKILLPWCQLMGWIEELFLFPPFYSIYLFLFSLSCVFVSTRTHYVYSLSVLNIFRFQTEGQSFAFIFLSHAYKIRKKRKSEMKKIYEFLC